MIDSCLVWVWLFCGLLFDCCWWLVGFYNLVLWFAYYYMLLDWMSCFCFDVWMFGLCWLCVVLGRVVWVLGICCLFVVGCLFCAIGCFNCGFCIVVGYYIG